MSTAESTDQTTVEPSEEPRKQPLFDHQAEVQAGDEHLFIRLPNQFQHADIRQAALAAKARRIRALRDPESDAFVILDLDMDNLLRVGDMEVLVDELVGRDWLRDYMEAVADVKEDEEFEHIERDEARLTELRELEPEARDGDEFNSLEKHVAAYHEAVRVAHEKRTQPRRDALLAKDREDLVNDIREERITADGNAVFNLYFSLHEVLNGTFYAETYTKGDGTPGVRPGKRYFSSITEVQTADPNLLDALTDAFSNLESSFASRFSGNS